MIFHLNAMSGENVRPCFDELIAEIMLDQKLKERSDLIMDDIWDQSIRNMMRPVTVKGGAASRMQSKNLNASVHQAKGGNASPRQSSSVNDKFKRTAFNGQDVVKEESPTKKNNARESIQLNKQNFNDKPKKDECKC